MKKILCILLAFSLALSLCACGGSSASAGTPAESAPAESTPAESEPAESEPECEHEWAPATYALPETCTLCGETRGEAKPTYFAENGLTASPVPGDGDTVPLTYLTYSVDDPEIFTVRDNGEVIFSQTIEPAEEEGYKLVTLNIMVTFFIWGDESTYSRYNVMWTNGLYDLYTGLKVPARSTMYDDGFSYETELTVDGTVYPLRYDKENRWESTSWEYDEEGNSWTYFYCYQTVTLLMPEEYDGLVYVLAPTLRVPADNNTETIDESEAYVLDLDSDVLEGCRFCRVGV